jgi:hypothetical protein
MERTCVAGLRSEDGTSFRVGKCERNQHLEINIK